MEYLTPALIGTIILFFLFGGDDLLRDIYKSKTEAAHERRLEAEARVEEARIKQSNRSDSS